MIIQIGLNYIFFKNKASVNVNPNGLHQERIAFVYFLVSYAIMLLHICS